MKRLISIFFLFIYLVSATELHELFKLPELVAHFIEHKTEDTKTTFLAFLVMHYSDSDNNSNEHQKLPFKAHHNSGNFLNAGLTTFDSICLVIKPTPIASKVYKTYTIEFISSSYLSSIWQPPKSC